MRYTVRRRLPKKLNRILWWGRANFLFLMNGGCYGVMGQSWSPATDHVPAKRWSRVFFGSDGGRFGHVSNRSALVSDHPRVGFDG